MSLQNECIFCKKYQQKEETNILFRDENIVIFPDIKPAAKHHYLIVTHEHIKDVKHLTKEQIPLVENLISHGNRILQENGADLTDARFGFHWPPFHSVSHLHMHVISPASEMSFIPRCIFKPKTMWFVTVFTDSRDSCQEVMNNPGKCNYFYPCYDITFFCVLHHRVFVITV